MMNKMLQEIERAEAELLNGMSPVLTASYHYAKNDLPESELLNIIEAFSILKHNEEITGPSDVDDTSFEELGSHLVPIRRIEK